MEFHTFKNPGDEATDVSGTGELAADHDIVALVEESNDSKSARAILYAVHESLARIIARTPELSGVVLSSIHGETSAHIRSGHVCKGRRREAERIVQDWVTDFVNKIDCYTRKTSQT